MGRNLMKLL